MIHTDGMFEEQRTDPREFLALPLRLADGSSAVTRDISASGMYLEIDGVHTCLAGPVVFEMQVAELGLKFVAEGDIVRIEQRPGKTGVAVQLRAPRFEPLA